MRTPQSVAALTEFGRTRLSKNFFMRDFLYSEIAAVHGLANIPGDPDLAIAAGKALCENLLEPLQDRFGRIAVRSAFRSEQVNGFGNEQQKAGKAAYSCSDNAKNYARHIWDQKDANGHMGAMATIIIPSIWDRFQDEGDWQKIAWWIHDNLPYSEMEFFPRYFAFNLGWHENPKRRIFSFVAPRGVLTKPGVENNDGSHENAWRALDSVQP